MKKIKGFIIIMAFFITGCLSMQESEKKALALHLSRVAEFENNYLSALMKTGNAEEFKFSYRKARIDVQDFIKEKEDLQKKYPGLRNFRVSIGSLPEEFRNSYYMILEKRRDISKTEYLLMMKFKAGELDTPEVFILGNSIKKAVFID